MSAKQTEEKPSKDVSQLSDAVGNLEINGDPSQESQKKKKKNKKKKEVDDEIDKILENLENGEGVAKREGGESESTGKKKKGKKKKEDGGEEASPAAQGEQKETSSESSGRKKANKKKKGVSPKEQTDPPTVPVSELFPDGTFPIGQVFLFSFTAVIILKYMSSIT